LGGETVCRCRRDSGHFLTKPFDRLCSRPRGMAAGIPCSLSTAAGPCSVRALFVDRYPRDANTAVVGRAAMWLGSAAPPDCFSFEPALTRGACTAWMPGAHLCPCHRHHVAVGQLTQPFGLLRHWTLPPAVAGCYTLVLNDCTTNRPWGCPAVVTVAIRLHSRTAGGRH
jgi:hypothetical protein